MFYLGVSRRILLSIILGIGQYFIDQELVKC